MKEQKKVGICTLYTGYNYGSALQAYSLKRYVESLGFYCDIIKLSGSIIKGRDFRIKKAFITLFRMFLYSNNKINVIKSFSLNNKNKINNLTIQFFDKFYDEKIIPIFISYKKLKRKAKTNLYSYFICGSDQIWNSTAFYVDPFYYLNFSPNNKKIAYAPSFGRDYVPDYNKKVISNFLLKIPNLSVREDSGKRIINEIIAKDATVCIDPTFLTGKDDWVNNFNLKENRIKYILVYFLNEPSEKASNFIEKLSSSSNLNIIYIGSGIKNDNYSGPIEFLEYVYNASYIITDSFHGVAFSIIFQKDFWVFERKYKTENQSTRIINILHKLDLDIRFDSDDININEKINYKNVNFLLNREIENSKKYLKESLGGNCE